MDGKVVTDFTVYALANAVALQPDGKIVVAGSASGLVRYNADGNLDTGFGVAGKVTTAFVTATAMALQADGKIVVVGQSPAGVARYNADGSLDATFGTGTVPASFTPNGVAIQGDGKIVVVGKAASPNFGDFAVERYNSDGTPDSSFGAVTTGFSGAGASGVILQKDGRILVVGDTVMVNSLQVFAALAIARYNADGSLDTTFGMGGKLVSTTMVVLRVGSVQLQPGVALQPDGRIVVVGFVNGQGQHDFGDFSVLRFLVNGSPDPSFGAGGSVITDFGGSEVARSLAIQPDGKIVVGGSATGFALARYEPDGSLDSTFGSGGKTITNFGSTGMNGLVLQPDGKIVVVGGEGHSFAVARYLADNVGTPNQRFTQQLYWDLLRRPVDSSGLASWSGQLDQGVSRTQVAAAIQSSAEYETLVVGDLYKLVLGRAVDASGLSTWVSFLNQGGTSEGLEAILLGADEFFVAHGSDNNQGFLPALYQIVLQRPIDPSGAQAWGQALQSGALSRQGVAAELLAGLESDGLELQTLYVRFLHRAADPGGLDTYTNALQHGVSNEQVALILIGSAEYFSRV